MARQTDNVIADRLSLISGFLSDIEVDYGEWEVTELARYQIEWADVIASGEYLDQMQDQMSADQKAEFEALKQRFLAASGELVRLGLENPFMP